MSKILNLLNNVQMETPGTGLAGEMVSFKEYYRMKENPFADAINPEYYFRTSSQRDASRKMYASAEEGISLGLLTGTAGTGKTMVSQLLLQSLDPKLYEVVLVLVTPGMSKSVMLKEILKEFGQEKLPSRTRDLIDLLHRTVIDLHDSGRRPVVLADEAHFLSSGALHTLRTVSNLETPGKKLCTILLFAESTFLRRLRHPSYRSLSSRMYHRVSLDAMSEEETAQYVNFRMMVAGARQDTFDEAALRAVHALSGGVCREVSRLCYLSLLEGACRGVEQITEKIVQDV